MLSELEHFKLLKWSAVYAASVVAQLDNLSWEPSEAEMKLIVRNAQKTAHAVEKAEEALEREDNGEKPND